MPELRLQNIQDIDAANNYLQQVFIPEFWNKNIMIEPKNKNSEFVPVPQHIQLDDILIQKFYRKIRNDHTFSYGNKLYLITSEIRKSIAKQEIEVRLSSDGDFTAYFAGQQLAVSEVTAPTKPSMYDLEIQKKLDAIELAEKLGNVTEAAKISGCSRETIYKNKRLLKEKGPQALKRTFNTDKHHKNRTAKNIEEKVISFSLDNPHLGQAQVYAQLKSQFNIHLSISTIRHIWLRENMNTMALRLQKAKSLSVAN